jgi:hypothetical protein
MTTKNLLLLITLCLALLAACSLPAPTGTPPPRPTAPPPPVPTPALPQTVPPAPTQCLEPNPPRTLVVGHSQELPDLRAAQAAAPFTVTAPAGWATPPALDRIIFTEADNGERNLSVTYQTWKPSSEWPRMDMEIIFAQSKQSIVEYLQAGLVNACALMPVSLRQGSGFTFWDAGMGKSNAAVLIWQERDLKISIWLIGQGAAPTADNPHPWDKLLLEIADSMKN